MDASENARGFIVVGIDGSPPADDALRWAAAEAARRGLAVRAVIAAEPPDAWTLPDGVPLLGDRGEIRRAVEDYAREHVEAVRRDLEEELRAVPVDVMAVTGPAVWVLTRQAQGAELLVVGHRGRGALRSTLLGSVGLSVVLRARCPVTVVPSPRPAPPAITDEAATVAGPLPVGPIA